MNPHCSAYIAKEIPARYWKLKDIPEKGYYINVEYSA